MSSDSQMTLLALTMASLAVSVPALVAFFLTRFALGPGAGAWLAGALGAGAGVYIVLVYMFPDTPAEVQRQTQPTTTLEVVLPKGYRGSFYLFLDSRLAALSSISPGRYRITVPVTGKALVGSIPNLSQRMDLIDFDFRYAGGQVAPVVKDSIAGGSQEHMGQSIAHWRPYVGTESEYEADRRRRDQNGTLFDELDVRRGLSSPIPLATPGR